MTHRRPLRRLGALAVECAPPHRSLDDPIVFPGESAAAHLHEFFGNVATDADSTYDSLQLGETSCDQPLDRVAYWVPALLDPMGRPVEPVRSVRTTASAWASTRRLWRPTRPG